MFFALSMDTSICQLQWLYISHLVCMRSVWAENHGKYLLLHCFATATSVFISASDLDNVDCEKVQNVNVVF